MGKLTLTLEEEIALLDKYRITPNELMFIRTLLILQDEEDPYNEGENEKLFQSYLEVLYPCEIKAGEVIQSLKDKGLILKSYNPGKTGGFDPYEIPINKPFIKALYKSSYEMGKELFDEYPQSTTINNNIVTLRNVASHFSSLEECFRRYGKAIGWNQEKHSHIIELIKWAKEYDMLKQCLSSFVINNAWLDLEALKEGDKLNVNLDAVKLI